MKRLQDFSQVELLTETAIKRISPGASCVTIELEDGLLNISPLAVGAEGKDSSVSQAFGIYLNLRPI
jgi:2-polyprenyl-6-methoxyphenol hydroxylase-like FAD-dependent oxidoreductase